MTVILLLCCAVILSCIIANRFSRRFGMPALLCFMALGMIFGSDGLLKRSTSLLSLALMIKRGQETLIPRGNTKIQAKDTLILSVPAYHSKNDGKLKEILIDPAHNWCDCSIADLNLPENLLIALIKRGDENIIPQGSTIIQANDHVVIYK